MKKIEFKPTHSQQTTIVAKNCIYEDTLAMVSYQFNGIHDEAKDKSVAYELKTIAINIHCAEECPHIGKRNTCI